MQFTKKKWRNRFAFIFKKNKINFAQILLENNADPNLLNKLYSQTATHLALINKINDENILLKLKKITQIYILLKINIQKQLLIMLKKKEMKIM